MGKTFVSLSFILFFILFQNVIFGQEKEYGLTAEYFSDPDLRSRVITKTDSLINFGWNAGKPEELTDVDFFSIRWSGYLNVRFSELYTFYVKSDDGARLWIDDKLIINNWRDQRAIEAKGTIDIKAGKHKIQLEYYEKTGHASVALSWSSNSQTKEIIPHKNLNPRKINQTEKGKGSGLTGEYFDNMEMAGLPKISVNPTINFNWRTDEPKELSKTDEFSIRWTGQVEALFSEKYKFHVISDDGTRLWIDNKLIINNWKDQGAKELSGEIMLEAGKKYPIRLDYYENTGAATVKLYWSSQSQFKEIVPKVYLFPAKINKKIKGKGTGLTAEYFKDRNLIQSVKIQTDPFICFNWKNESPDPIIPNDKFGICWDGYIQAHFSEKYTFTISSDDGYRLWIDEKLIIDHINHWNYRTSKEERADIELKADQKYKIKLEYYEGGGKGSICLNWQSKSQMFEVVPQDCLFELSASEKENKIRARGITLVVGVKQKTIPDNELKRLKAEVQKASDLLFKISGKELYIKELILNIPYNKGDFIYDAYYGNMPEGLSDIPMAPDYWWPALIVHELGHSNLGLLDDDIGYGHDWQGGPYPCLMNHNWKQAYCKDCVSRLGLGHMYEAKSLKNIPDPPKVKTTINKTGGYISSVIIVSKEKNDEVLFINKTKDDHELTIAFKTDVNEIVMLQLRAGTQIKIEIPADIGLDFHVESVNKRNKKEQVLEKQIINGVRTVIVD